MTEPATAASDLVPLSRAQQRLWFLHCTEPMSTEFNNSRAVRITGVIDEAAIVKTVEQLVCLHPCVGVRIVQVAGVPYLSFQQSAPPLIRIDLRQISFEQREATLMQHRAGEWNIRFDLAAEQPFRFKLVRASDEEALLIRTAHHIATDGQSEDVLGQDIVKLYRAHSGQALAIPRKPNATYADYSVWEQKWLTAAFLAEGRKFWAGYLRDRSWCQPELREDEADQAPTYIAASVASQLKSEEEEAVRRLCGTLKVTLFVFMAAVLGVAIARRTRRSDVVILAPVSLRPDERFERVVGLFVNSLPIRFDVRPGVTVRRLIQQVNAACYEALRYRHMPLEEIGACAAAPLKGGRRGLPTDALVMHREPVIAAEEGCETVPSDDARVHNDRELHICYRPGHIQLKLLCRSVVPQDSARAELRHLIDVAGRFAGAPDTAVGRLV